MTPTYYLLEIAFDCADLHNIESQSVQFLAKYSYGTVERRMLSIVSSWATTVHKIQGITIE